MYVCIEMAMSFLNSLREWLLKIVLMVTYFGAERGCVRIEAQISFKKYFGS